MATCTATVATSTTDLPPGAIVRQAPLDALRGFALLGILLMNSEFFTRPMQGIALGFDPQWQGVDRAAGLLVATFVQGKFWILFSLLFGMGFAVQQARGDAGMVRRLLALLAIGVLHATLVWSGDILVLYAVAGFALWLLDRQVPPEQLSRVALALWALPLFLMWTSVLAVHVMPTPGASDLVAETANDYRDDYAAAARIYAEGSFAQVTKQRVEDSLMQYSWATSSLPSILGVFLFGAWLWRRGVLREPARHRALFGQVVMVGVVPGVALAVIGEVLLVANDPTALTPALALGATLTSLGSLVLCAVYAAAFLWLATREESRLPAWLAPAGRMALSNYLAQSLVFTTLYYGYGFDAWGEVPRAQQLVLSIAFFGLQVIASRAWLARFRFGPAEWAWRAVAWRQWPSLRR